MAAIKQKNVGQPDDEVSYGEQGLSAKVTLGFSGLGLRSTRAHGVLLDRVRG